MEPTSLPVSLDPVFVCIRRKRGAANAWDKTLSLNDKPHNLLHNLSEMILEERSLRPLHVLKRVRDRSNDDHVDQPQRSSC
jgi:hypothetical protein